MRLPVLTLLLAAASARAVPIAVPIDVNGLAAKGQAAVTATTFDINDATKIFDADRDSLARTANINPAFVQVVFTQPQTITGVRVRFTSEAHTWRVLADGKSVASQTVKGDDPQTIDFDVPVTAKTFRLDVRRMEGDNYVHILDWELLQPGDVSGLTISKPDKDVMEDSVVKLTASVKTADGRTLDVTKDVRWSSASPGVSTWRKQANAFLLEKPGDATITATLGGTHYTIKQNFDGGAPSTTTSAGLTGSVTIPVKAYGNRNNDFDLDAMYIERLPRIAYDANKPTGGWPRDGQRVQWVAHLHNWGDTDVPQVGYRWVLDGKTVSSGVLKDWKAGTDASTSLPWNWEKARHSLTFLLDPDGAWMEESTRANNRINIDTDALAVGYWVEDGLSRHMHEHQREMGDGMNSFEDWGQRQMNLWNRMFREARYGTAPEGITDRVRLDYVVHVPSGALPLNGGLPTNNPDGPNKTVDLMWGMVARDLTTFWEPKTSGPFFYEYGLIHELDHARYLIDSYGFDVHKVAVEKLVGPDGKPLLGTPAMPYKGGDVVRYDKYRGMMDSTHYFSEYEAYAWNRIAGQRARKGNQNGPDDIGAYLNEDLPQRNHIRIVDTSGKPLAGASVELHQARPRKDEWYGKLYEQAPDATYTADGDGWVTLPRCPFGKEIVHGYGHANSVLLLLVRAGNLTRSCFVEASDFNLQYYKGQHDDATYQVTLDLSPDTKRPGEIEGLSGKA